MPKNVPQYLMSVLIRLEMTMAESGLSPSQNPHFKGIIDDLFHVWNMHGQVTRESMVIVVEEAASSRRKALRLNDPKIYIKEATLNGDGTVTAQEAIDHLRRMSPPRPRHV